MSAVVEAPVTPTHADEELVRVYVWQIPVRITHWLIAGSIAVLSVTGFYIGRPFVIVAGPAGESFVMGWMKVIHAWTAYVFIGAVLVRLIWMFTGNKYSHWDKFISINPTRLKGFMPTVFFYMFLRDKPPGYVGHNPVAASAYTMVFALYFLAIATGLVMSGASAHVDSPMRWLGTWAPLFGGLQMARWIHHIVMWLLLGFTVHHIYSAVLVAMVEKTGTIDSIISGYKWVPKHELGRGPYRWPHNGELDE